MSDAAPPKKRAFDTYKTTIEVADLVTPRNIHLKFKFQDGKTMDFKSGQFVQVFVPLPDNKVRRTSYSIASSPIHKDFFELCVTKVEGGKSSGFLHSLKKGDEVTVMGPLGKFTQPDPLPRDVAFICTGSGVAPFRSMIHNLLENKTDRKLHLLFGNRYDEDIIYQKDWESLASKEGQFSHFFTLSRPTEKWGGEKGYVQDKIEKAIPDVKSKDYYICGLSNMINAVQAKLESLGVPKDQIHYEKYD